MFRVKHPAWTTCRRRGSSQEGPRTGTERAWNVSRETFLPQGEVCAGLDCSMFHVKHVALCRGRLVDLRCRFGRRLDFFLRPGDELWEGRGQRLRMGIDADFLELWNLSFFLGAADAESWAFGGAGGLDRAASTSAALVECSTWNILREVLREAAARSFFRGCVWGG
jgi:hypothetical protein